MAHKVHALDVDVKTAIPDRFVTFENVALVNVSVKKMNCLQLSKVSTSKVAERLHTARKRRSLCTNLHVCDGHKPSLISHIFNLTLLEVRLLQTYSPRTIE